MALDTESITLAYLASPILYLCDKRSPFLFMGVFGIGMPALEPLTQKLILNFGSKSSKEIGKETRKSIFYSRRPVGL
jgi:hypothetical protein